MCETTWVLPVAHKCSQLLSHLFRWNLKGLTFLPHRAIYTSYARVSHEESFELAQERELEIIFVPCWDDGRDVMAALQQEELGELPHILF